MSGDMNQGDFFKKTGSPAMKWSDVLPDEGDDFIGTKLKQMRAIPTFTRQKQKLRHDLEVMSPYFGYVRFYAKAERFMLKRVEDSIQYDVPLNKRGHLQRFAGKRIRLIVLWSCRFDHVILAGPVNPLDA